MGDFLSVDSTRPLSSRVTMVFQSPRPGVRGVSGALVPPMMQRLTIQRYGLLFLVPWNLFVIWLGQCFDLRLDDGLASAKPSELPIGSDLSERHVRCPDVFGVLYREALIAPRLSGSLCMPQREIVVSPAVQPT